MDVKDLLLERAVEPLDDPIALWAPDEGGGLLKSQECHLEAEVP